MNPYSSAAGARKPPSIRLFNMISLISYLSYCSGILYSTTAGHLFDLYNLNMLTFTESTLNYVIIVHDTWASEHGEIRVKPESKTV